MIQKRVTNSQLIREREVSSRDTNSSQKSLPQVVTLLKELAQQNETIIILLKELTPSQPSKTAPSDKKPLKNKGRNKKQYIHRIAPIVDTQEQKSTPLKEGQAKLKSELAKTSLAKASKKTTPKKRTAFSPQYIRENSEGEENPFIFPAKIKKKETSQQNKMRKNND